MPKLALLLALAAGPAAAVGLALPEPARDAEFRNAPTERILLGRDLFFDPILSGNRTVSCASCHHPAHATADAVSLGLGDGATGLGPARAIDPENLPEQRIPRNAPALWNLGHRSFTVFFHDGRLEEDLARPSGLRTPLEDEMVLGFDSALSAQAMFPVLSPDEMAGHYEENDVAQAVRQGLITGPDGAWSILAARVAAIPAYADRFAAAYPEIAAGRPLAFTDIANALADFVAHEFRADDSPFDRHLRGEAPLAGAAATGMALFYGRAGCGTCHSGPFQTDHAFHAMAMPQLGPGKSARFERHQRDIGRMRVTGRPEDAFRFRTPSLRMVALTAPYGHSGAYPDLASVVRHMADPLAAFDAYDRAGAVLPDLPGAARPDWAILDDPAEAAAIRAAAETDAPIALTEAEIDSLVAFLHALTDENAAAGRLGVPETVPSGLPVDQPAR
jgi:cytochrome c peroxidase